MGPMHDVIIVAIVFFSIVSVVKILSDNRIRHKMMEKGQMGNGGKQPGNGTVYQSLSALKWGFVLIGLGLALLIGQMVPSGVEEEVVIGSMFFLAGAGLLLFYWVAGKLANKADDTSVRKNN
ncbi:hypothetical protein JW948_10640 [bacterium]|nr:hypothetical protein [bacterium]